MNKIPLAVPIIGDVEKKCVSEALLNNYIAIGPHVKLFEEQIANFLGAKNAIALNSGTAALQLMIEASDLIEGDVILVPSLTFGATINAIIHAGCEPCFIDIDPSDLCVSPASIERFLEERCHIADGRLLEKETGKSIKGIMVVHMYGNVCNMPVIVNIAKKYGLEIFEDGTEALGAKFNNVPLGSNSRFFGLSFNGNKIITSGGGGMLLTNDSNVADKVRRLAAQGKSMHNPEEIEVVGHNFKMPNLNAALAYGQSLVLGDHLERKQMIAREYNARLGKLKGMSMITSAPDTWGVFWMVVFRLDPKKIGFDALRLGPVLADAGIETRPVWKPLDSMLPYKKFLKGDLKFSYEAYQMCICLPCSVNLNIDDIEYICEKIERLAAN